MAKSRAVVECRRIDGWVEVNGLGSCGFGTPLSTTVHLAESSRRTDVDGEFWCVDAGVPFEVKLYEYFTLGPSISSACM